ncbi:methyltransferase family protein [Actinoplanes sp. NPDC049681]|uniref:methyltransferase family protein n=1 Tax=Actinoplanes sp. NPDC049681 TaxID=3363905 RepID=UPI0037975590
MTQRLTVACLRVLLPAAVAAFVIGISGHLRWPDEPVHLAAAAMGGGYLLWLVGEARITVRHPDELAAENHTLLPYALARIGTGVSAILWPLHREHLSPWLAVLAVAFVAAVVLRLVAIRTLGRFYSHHVVRYRDHAIVTSGPYRFARHPAYTGMLLANAAFVAFFGNPLSLLFLIALSGVIVWRIRVEERVLFTVPGYPVYADGRARLVPGVW